MEFSFWTVIGILAAACTSFSFIPQVWKMWRNRSAKDVSNVTMLQLIAGCTLWLVYGISLNDYVIIGANIVADITLVMGLLLYYRFHVKEA